MTAHAVATFSALKDRDPTYALVGKVDLVVVRTDDEASAFYGRCLHRSALMSDGFVRGKNLICGDHDWDYQLDSSVSSYDNSEKLPKFKSWDKLAKVQAFHFKGGQGAETGAGGPLPGAKVKGEIAEVRGLEPGTPAISPSRFPDWTELQQIKDFAADVREKTGGILIGYKLSAQHIEQDIDAALEIGVDDIILDGHGDGTDAAPTILRDHISVPTIPALARVRAHLDGLGRKDVTLVIAGGLRTPAAFVKALALGADAIALSNSAMQAIGCLAMRACRTNNCPVRTASQKPHLVNRCVVDKSAKRLTTFFNASVELMQVMARACGHTHLSKFELRDLTT